MLLCGRFRILLLYDVAEAFDLNRLRELLGPRGGPVKQVFRRRTPEYVRFEHAPIVEPNERITLSTGEKLECTIRYYNYAVVVVQLEVPFECGWADLLAQAYRWMDTAGTEPCARELIRSRLDLIAPAVTGLGREWVNEEYFVVELQEVRDGDTDRPTAADLLSKYGDQIVQLVRGEPIPLSHETTQEALQGSLSYYPADLVIAESSVALVYEQLDDASATIQVLEYAKMQLLEFRYYDNFMTRVLSDVYSALERRRNILLSRWRLPGEASSLNTIRLDVMELTERIDNAIKFVSDMFYARVYRLAANRMGVSDYRKLVEQKLRTAGELYDIMVAQFNEARTFVLEISIAVLCLLDVILLLRGK
jgi:hypothetical protein